MRDLAPVVARLQLEDARGELMFGPGSIQDPDNSEQQIANLDQGGLGLPDRDYYTNDDAKSKENPRALRAARAEDVRLLGDSPEMAQEQCRAVMRMETALAKASQTDTERRDPYKLKHKMSSAGAGKAGASTSTGMLTGRHSSRPPFRLST